MTSVGLVEAKAQWSRLLGRVSRGEKILITRHGKPAAMLVPPPKEAEKKEAAKDVRQIVKEMLDYRDRKGPSLGGISVRELIEEGRRY
jgi:prevent-host-death family protein